MSAFFVGPGEDVETQGKIWSKQPFPIFTAICDLCVCPQGIIQHNLTI